MQEGAHYHGFHLFALTDGSEDFCHGDVAHDDDYERFVEFFQHGFHCYKQELAD